MVCHKNRNGPPTRLRIAAIQRHLGHRIADDVQRREELVLRLAQVDVIAVQRDNRWGGRFER